MHRKTKFDTCYLIHSVTLSVKMSFGWRRWDESIAVLLWEGLFYRGR